MQGGDSDHDIAERQKRIPGWNQEKVRRTRVLVAGAGALGNELVKNLVMLGINHIFIVDHDRIVQSNLNRCVFFTLDDALAQSPKARVLATRAMQLNPEVKVTPIEARLEEMDKRVYKEVDLAFGGLDNLAARLQLNIDCYVNNVPIIDGRIEELLGQVQVVVPRITSCLECAVTARDRDLMWQKISCSGSLEQTSEPKIASLSATNSIIAGIQVLEAIKLVHGLETFKERGEWDSSFGAPLAGKCLFYSGFTNTLTVYEVERSKSCTLCSSTTSENGESHERKET